MCQILRATQRTFTYLTLPGRPWQKVAADLFEVKAYYLIVMDYFSRYPEVVKLSSTTSSSVINTLKSIIARHGIPTKLVNNNGPQFISCEIKHFHLSIHGPQLISREIKHFHLFISAHYKQPWIPPKQLHGGESRGIVKRLLQNVSDPSFSANPLSLSSLSPAELLFGRKIKH